MSNKTAGEVIREARTRLKLTQWELAVQANCPAPYVCKLERNTTQSMSAPMRQKMLRLVTAALNLDYNFVSSLPLKRQAQNAIPVKTLQDYSIEDLANEIVRRGGKGCQIIYTASQG